MNMKGLKCMTFIRVRKSFTKYGNNEKLTWPRAQAADTIIKSR
jgi:hypothetical protein